MQLLAVCYLQGLVQAAEVNRCLEFVNKPSQIPHCAFCICQASGLAVALIAAALGAKTALIASQLHQTIISVTFGGGAAQCFWSTILPQVCNAVLSPRHGSLHLQSCSSAQAEGRSIGYSGAMHGQHCGADFTYELG